MGILPIRVLREALNSDLFCCHCRTTGNSLAVGGCAIVAKVSSGGKWTRSRVRVDDLVLMMWFRWSEWQVGTRAYRGWLRREGVVRMKWMNTKSWNVEKNCYGKKKTSRRDEQWIPMQPDPTKACYLQPMPIPESVILHLLLTLSQIMHMSHWIGPSVTSNHLFFFFFRFPWLSSKALCQSPQLSTSRSGVLCNKLWHAWWWWVCIWYSRVRLRKGK